MKTNLYLKQLDKFLRVKTIVGVFIDYNDMICYVYICSYVCMYLPIPLQHYTILKCPSFPYILGNLHNMYKELLLLYRVTFKSLKIKSNYVCK